MNKYVVIFDFRTYFDDKMGELVKELSFVPQKEMSIFFADGELKLPEDMENKGWFQVADIDYLIKDDVFVVGLKPLGNYTMEED